MLNKINRVIRQIEIWISVVGFALMLILVTYNVLNRFIFKTPITWTDEATRYLMIWVSIMASGIAVIEHSHSNVSVIVDKAPAKIGKTLKVIAYIIAIIICLVVVIGGIVLCFEQSAQLSPAMQIPMRVVYLALPIGFGFMAYSFFVHLVNTIKERQDEVLEEDATEVIV